MLKHFPFKAPRSGTEEAIKAVDAAIAAGQRFILIDAPTGCHAAGTKVIMFDGTLKNVEDIKVGDLLMGPDSRQREVLSLFSGVDELYKVIPLRGGNEFVVNSDHIISLMSTNEGVKKRNSRSQKGGEITNISVKDYLLKSKSWKHLRKLYRASVDFEGSEGLNLDPYLLGILLGDGSIIKSVGLTTNDTELVNYFKQIGTDYSLNWREESKKSTECKTYYLTRNTELSSKNHIAEILKDLGLYGLNSGSKFIPHKYKVSSIKNRCKILAGLLDTDGSLNGNCFDYVTKSFLLAGDVAFIARSLGFMVSNGIKIVKGVTYYRLNISGDTDKIPTILPRKKASIRRQVKNVLVSGFSIENVGRGNFYGFELSGDHLYLLEDFTVTHNSGKSGIAVAFSRKYKTTVWTPTKLLQEQYANTDEFVFEYTIKGKANYNCGLPGQGQITVDEAICCSSKVVDENRGLVPFSLPKDLKNLSKALKNTCAEKGICPYYTKLYNIAKTPGAILNYDLGLQIKPNPKREYGGVNMGEHLVMDEAHQLISKAQSIFGQQITNTGVMKLFGQEAKRGPQESVMLWLNRLATISNERAQAETDPKRVAKFTSFQRKLSQLLELDIQDEKRFLIEDRGAEVEVKPLDLRYFKGQLFYPFKHILMLSATFPANFRQVLGIKEDECTVIKINSTFKPENRRIVFPADICNMNAATVLSKTSQQIVALDKILEAHAEDKGIVHCGNYKFFDQLKGIYKSNKRFIWVDQDKSKEQMFELHKNSTKPTVLVSPAMSEGVDLKDDLARFGVLLKIAYPALDEYNKRMGLIFNQWYENLTMTSIVQSYGRQVRNEEDFATFYIIDGAFNILLNRNKNLIPAYFAEALKIGDMGRFMKILNKKIDTHSVKNKEV